MNYDLSVFIGFCSSTSDPSQRPPGLLASPTIPSVDDRVKTRTIAIKLGASVLILSRFGCELFDIDCESPRLSDSFICIADTER
jgi:hypothetical protein